MSLLPTQPSDVDVAIKLFKLDAELCLLRAVGTPLLLVPDTGLFGLRLGRLLVVDEMGMRGGGIPSYRLFACVDGLLFVSVALVGPLLELERFHDMLSLRRSELMEDGVEGSSLEGIGGGDLGILMF